MEKAVIYARYSSSGQREESIEGQIRECRQYADHAGFRVVGEYADHALTGTNDKRPDFQRMIRDSAKGQFSAVIVWKYDRFARNRYDSAIYKAKLKKNGVRLLSAKEGIPDGPEGILLESMMEGYAEYYSANLSQNVKRGLYESALKRRFLGAHVPLGLRISPEGSLVPDPATAPIIKRIYEEYASGKPAADICRDLNNEGYRTAQGNKFGRNSIPQTVRNERYKGVYAYADIRDENAIPAIVSPELWDKANSIRQKRHEAPASSKMEGGFLLTGKLFCGLCGAPMTGDGGTSKTGKVYSYYTCANRRRHNCPQNRVPKDWIENTIVDALVSAAHSDDLINAFADRFMEWQDKHNDKSTIKKIQDSLLKNKEAYNNTLSLVDQGIITDQIKQHIKDLETERAALESTLSQEKLNAPSIKRSEVVFFLKSFRSGDPQDPAWRIFLVDTFLASAFVSNNPPPDPNNDPTNDPDKSARKPSRNKSPFRIALTLNYSAPNNTISLNNTTTHTTLSINQFPNPTKTPLSTTSISSNFSPLPLPFDAKLNPNEASAFFYLGSLIILLQPRIQ